MTVINMATVGVLLHYRKRWLLCELQHHQGNDSNPIQRENMHEEGP